jgi:hypothetical protein
MEILPKNLEKNLPAMPKISKELIHYFQAHCHWL